MRLVLALVAALVVAAPAGSRATADPPAELFVFPFATTPGATAETDVDLSLPPSSTLAIASVTVYVPAGYALDGDRPVGSAIGAATVFAAGSPVPLSAGLFTADPAASAADPCAPGSHAAVWTAALGSSSLTVFVDPPAGDESSLGAYKLVYCASAASGRIVDVDLDLQSGLTNPSAPVVLTWRAVVTPAAGEPFELRSIVALPQLLTLRTAFASRTSTLTLSGKLLFAGTPRPGINVHFAVAGRADLADAQKVGVARTRRDGSYLLRRSVHRTSVKRQLLLIAYVNFYDGDCSDPPLVPGGCADQTVAPPPAQIVAIG
jgi:hypothetical protein